MKKFEEGEWVILPAMEDQPEERGKVTAVEGRGMYIVEVQPQDEDDDGIREVHASNMKKCVQPKEK